MNLEFNGDTNEDKLKLFRFIEDFVYSNLKDKDTFYNLTVSYNENYLKEDVLLKPCGNYSIQYDVLRPSININCNLTKLYADSLIREKDREIKSYEQYKALVIFHEFAHLVIGHNSNNGRSTPEFANTSFLDREEENDADNMAKEYLRNKNIYGW